MAHGARSIRGSLGAYLAASVVALVALALALWLGWPAAGADAGSAGRIELASGSAWVEAALDDGRRQYSLARGQGLEVPPGRYRLTLLAPDGRTESRTIELGAGETLLH